MIVRGTDDVIIPLRRRRSSRTIQWVQMRVIIKQDRLINRTERSSDDVTIVSGAGASSSEKNGIFRGREREREKEINRELYDRRQPSLKDDQKNEAIDLAPAYRELKRSANGLCVCIPRRSGVQQNLSATNLDIKKRSSVSVQPLIDRKKRLVERQRTDEEARDSARKFRETIMKHHGHHLKPHSS